MKNPIPLRRIAAAVVPFALLLGGALDAQVPPNHLIVGTGPDLRSPGNPGLFYVSLETGNTIRVTNLPMKFRSQAGFGVRSVLRRPSDEAIFLGSGATEFQSPTVTMLTMNGSAVVQTKTAILGTLRRGWSLTVSALSLMPDGRRVLVGTPSSLLGPMAGHRLGIIDFDSTPPTVTPIPLTGPLTGTFVWDVVMSPDGRTAFVMTITGNNAPTPNRPFRLYMVDIQSGDTAFLHGDANRSLKGLRLVSPDVLQVSALDIWSSNPIPSNVLEFLITGWGTATMTSHPGFDQLECAGGGGLDLATGNTAMGSHEFLTYTTSKSSPNPFSLFTVDHRTGAIELLTGPPASGWGAPWGLDIHGVMENYGAATDGQNHYSFETFPNPGGSPTVGNTGFTLTMASAPGTAAVSALALSFGRGSTTILGAEILVDLASTVAVPVPTGSSVPYALPIPNVPSLIGLVVTAQSVHLEASGVLVASRGLEITVH
jgi:hypothetical protein